MLGWKRSIWKESLDNGQKSFELVFHHDTRTLAGRYIFCPLHDTLRYNILVFTPFSILFCFIHSLFLCLSTSSQKLNGKTLKGKKLDASTLEQNECVHIFGPFFGTYRQAFKQYKQKRRRIVYYSPIYYNNVILSGKKRKSSLTDSYYYCYYNLNYFITSTLPAVRIGKSKLGNAFGLKAKKKRRKRGTCRLYQASLETH